MIQNPLSRVPSFGQSLWLDYIRRGMLASGELQSLIREDGILGVTSNPSIFEKAIAGTSDYDDSIRSSTLEGLTAKEIYQQLTIADIQAAADLFHSTYERTKQRDGYVSLEVSPLLAHKTQETLLEARKLWKTVDRPNVMIKVPATEEGIPAIRQLISEGINVNVTLLFSLERYAQVLDAYITGLQIRLKSGKPIRGIASVASFFLSRIDVATDRLLPLDSKIRGKVAIASAKLAYEKYKGTFDSDLFRFLRTEGAQTQRLLWASTSSKNPSDSDIKYVEALIGPDTVDTIPVETMKAYRDHGNPTNSLEFGTEEAANTMALLAKAGIEISDITQKLEDEGVHLFSAAFDKLMTAIELKRTTDAEKSRGPRSATLSNCADTVESRIRQLESEQFVPRIWRQDASLWKEDPEAQSQIKGSLGWLHIAEKMQGAPLDELRDFAREIRSAGFRSVIHMGMGGSSLASLVFARTFPAKDGLPLTVLDTTDASTILKIEHSIDVAKTLFIVASKSGTTAEPLAFKDYFFERVRAVKGDRAGENFIAITDPDTLLAQQAKAQKFRHVFLGEKDIGGRYSALSYFGLVPAQFLGVDVSEILKRAQQGALAVSPPHPGIEGKVRPLPPTDESSPLNLGAALGEMAKGRRNKVTLLIEKPVEALGPWVEQLLAESTGKEGRGLIPICDEPIGMPSSYGDDRLFVHIKMRDSTHDSGNDLLRRAAAALIGAGQPVISMELSDINDLGYEFFRWEFATAIAGSILGVNAFDQPNVQESKDNTDRLLSKPRKETEVPERKLSDGGLDFYSTLEATSSASLFKQFFELSFPGDYMALMAFLPESALTYELLQSLRKNVRDHLKLATTLGFGPRFLHSTGQLHKGGPATGLFLQLTADDFSNVPIPGRDYNFEIFKNAQARGDFAALKKHGDRVLRVHLGSDIEAGLRRLGTLVAATLREL